MKHATILRAAAAGLLVMLAAGPAKADLGEAATNPVSNLVQFRLQNQFSASNYNAGDWGNAAIVQTVIPLPSIANRFDSLKGVVTRATLPYVSTPKLDGAGRRHGMGDTNFLASPYPRLPRRKPCGASARR